MANIDDRVLWECNSDLNSDGEITSDDAVIFYSILKWAENPSVKSSVSFSDYYNELVIAGEVPDVDISSVNPDIFNRIPECFDFNFSGQEEDCDTEILDAFNAYLKAENKTDLNVNDVNNFILFLRSLKAQGLINCDIQANSSIMLPTIPKQDKIYFSNDVWIPKVPDGDVGYDESYSTKGKLVDSSGEKFLISDPTVKTYYGWDGETSPRSWLSTGLCKVYTRTADNLTNEYGVIHPPVDVIKNKTISASDIVPMGTPNIFNGRTIAIDGDHVAVGWHYSTTGVVYIYKDNGAGTYTNIHEIILDYYDFSQGLPVIELRGTEVFITNPQMQVESIVVICDFNGVGDYTINLDNTSAISMLFAPSGPTSVVGFGSCMKVNDEQTKLFIGHPKQERTLSWQIDQYTIEETDIFAGAVFVYTKSGGNWSYSETIYPDLSDYESRSLASDLDIQFGYSIEYKNNNLFISAPRSFNVSKERREGSVHCYTYTSSNMTSVLSEQFNIENSTNQYELYFVINYSDAKFDTFSISSGLWNFGMSIVSNSTATKIFILHNIPSQGTFVSYYSKTSGEFILGTEFFYTISSDILIGNLAISASDATKVFTTDNIVKVLV